MKTGEGCDNCKFWFEDGEGDSGTCRRYPPTLLFEDADSALDTVWPDTWKDNWCGEWKSKWDVGSRTGVGRKLKTKP